MLKATIDSKQASAQLRDKMRMLDIRLSQLHEPMEDFTTYHVVATKREFETSGRGPVKWKATRGGRKPLFRTGGLQRSIQGETVTRSRDVVSRTFTKHPLAPIHQKGARVPAHTIKPRTAKALRFTVGGRTVFSMSASIPAFNIPARLILFYTDDDRAMAVKSVRKFLEVKIKRAKGR